MLNQKNKFKKYIHSIVLSLIALFLCGCSTLSYVGDDVKQENLQTIKTQEDFTFKTVKKSLGDVSVSMGITRTQVPEILVLYVKIDNLSNQTYVFRVSDIELHNPQERLHFVSANDFLREYQNQEAQSISSMSQFGATITNMTNMYEYQEYNQTKAQNATELSNRSTFAQIKELGDKILTHSIKYSSAISSKKSQYFYFFFVDEDEYPLTIKYKTLSYQFKL